MMFGVIVSLVVSVGVLVLKFASIYNWDVATIPQCAFIRERVLCGDMIDSNRVICSSMLHWGGQQIGVICGSSCEFLSRLGLLRCRTAP